MGTTQDMQIGTIAGGAYWYHAGDANWDLVRVKCFYSWIMPFNPGNFIPKRHFTSIETNSFMMEAPLLFKSMDWLLYDSDLRHERVKILVFLQKLQIFF